MRVQVFQGNGLVTVFTLGSKQQGTCGEDWSPAQSPVCRSPPSSSLASWGSSKVRQGWATVEPTNVFLLPDPARELKVLIGNLLELLTEVGVSGQGRDNALTLLIKVVPRKSFKDPNNSLTLWVIDQGR